MVHVGALTRREKKVVFQLSVKRVPLSVSLVYSSTLRFVVSEAALGVWMREMNWAIRRV